MVSSQHFSGRSDVGATRLPEVGEPQADLPPVLRHSPIVHAEPERAGDDALSVHSSTGSRAPSRDITVRSHDSQRIIDDLRHDLRQQGRELRQRDRDVRDQGRKLERLMKALEKRDAELKAMRGMMTEGRIKYDRLVELTERDVMRKQDRMEELARKKAKFVGLGKSGDQEVEESNCFVCNSRHTGHCSAKTRRCHRCREIGHDASGCKNPPLCYNCRGTGHISSACPREKRAKQSCFRCGETGHLIRDCPKSKEMGAKNRMLH